VLPAKVLILSNVFCRAHSYFKQALAADPEDGETLSRYASFLWLGLGNFEIAEVAYKAAIAADPTNPYFTGSYAHFLWHAREDETSCPIGGDC
jgi:cytochrome c-type biogenesis protein CcmH/NrfG